MAGEATIQVINSPLGSVETPSGDQLLVGEKTVEVLTVGLQGPPGANGIGTNFRAIAEVPLSGQRIVRFSASGQLAYASNAPLEFENTCGITNAAAIAGDSVEVVSAGEFENVGWNWTPGAPLFLGLNGFLTEVSPDTGVWLQFATAISSTKIFINIEAPIFL